MIRTLTRVGKSYGLLFDAALRELTGLKAGDQVDVTVCEDGAVILVPIPKGSSAAEVRALVKRTLEDYRRTLRRLA